MAILKIARMGHPVLRRRAQEIENPNAPEIRALIGDMLETMEDADGAGLAAPQVHVPLRLAIFHVPPDRAEDEGEERPVPLTVLINPVIEPLTEAMELGWEGCLSVPGLIGAVPRFTRIRYRGVAPDGSAIDRTAEGFHARVVQHECDHLDGILYPQRMTDLSQLMFRDQMRHQARNEDFAEDADEEVA
jgi:peptide deformylase